MVDLMASTKELLMVAWTVEKLGLNSVARLVGLMAVNLVGYLVVAMECLKAVWLVG